MRTKRCNRLLAMKEEMVKDWDKLNFSAKLLTFIGALLLGLVIAISFSRDILSSNVEGIEMIFRAGLSSVFGFLLSSNMKSNKKNTSVDNLRRNNIDDDDENCNEAISKYNYGCGNIVQMTIAFAICLISIITIFLLYSFDIKVDPDSIAQFRGLMCSSIGFLVGEATIKK